MGVCLSYYLMGYNFSAVPGIGVGRVVVLGGEVFPAMESRVVVWGGEVFPAVGSVEFFSL